MLPLALQEEDEIAHQQHLAEDSQEDPERRKRNYVDEHYDQPEDYREELSEPEDHFVAGSRTPILGRLEAPGLLVGFIQLGVPPECSQLPSCNVLGHPKIHTQQYRHNDKSRQILIGGQFKQKISI